MSVVHNETSHVVEKQFLKRKTSLRSNLDNDNIPSKIRKTENVTIVFTEIPRELNASKSFTDNSPKVFGLSNLNPYRSVSFHFYNNEPSNKTK